MKLLCIQPHSDDLLLSAASVLFNSEKFDSHILCVENDPKRISEDEKLYKFLGLPYQHLCVDFCDKSYYEFFHQNKVCDSATALTFCEEYFGVEVLNNIREALIGAVNAFLSKNKGAQILAPLGIGHPFHLFVHDVIEGAFDHKALITYYREFPHSYKRRNQAQMKSAAEMYALSAQVPVVDFADVKWALASKFYRTQSGLLFYEQGYIKKNLPEEFYGEKIF